MFTFLSRFGRLLVAIPILVAVTAIIGFSTLSLVPAASKQSASPTGSLTLDNADPSFGGTVKFTASYSTMKWVPEESINCTASGQNVYLDVQTYSGSSPWTSSWTLWSQTWANSGGGPASCTAKLFYYTWQGKTETGVVYLASSSFSAT
jgi:hypothetical protein